MPALQDRHRRGAAELLPLLLRPCSLGSPQEQHQAGGAPAGQQAQQSRLPLLSFLPFSEIIFFPLNNHSELFLFLI